MKVVVLGGTGLIGSRLVEALSEIGCEAIAASPSSGVNTVTGEGLADVLENAQAVVDVTNSPVYEDAAVMHFFETSTIRILAAEKASGVGHHVLLSVVGAGRMQDSGYMRAKIVQEKLVRGAAVPFTILLATQFFEFLGAIANANTVGDAVRLPPAWMQPVAAGDVAAALTDLAVGSPVNATIEIAGPEQFRMDELVQEYLKGMKDPRKVITDEQARYFGAELDARSLLPGDAARVGSTRFAAWSEGG